jgi:hypothetical protein
VKLVSKISVAELTEMSNKMYDALVKAVVDVEQELVVVDAGLHSDEEMLLLEMGSRQSDLWGINLWPEEYGTDDFVEFDSMINLRPGQGNMSRGVDDEATRARILEIIAGVVHE